MDPATILVVDDDRGVQALVARRLEAAGYRVQCASSAAEALTTMERTLPDMVLMDIAMPGMDGVEACRRITQRRPDVPVVFLTAHGEVDERVRALDAGGRDEMPKPFHATELIARVRATLRERALRDAAERRAEAFERLSLTDALAGVWNRRYLEVRLPDELARAQRYRHPVACLMVDIDDFKRINDQHGHDVGDRAIAHVARILTRGLRAVDFVARYGGEEFAVILPETPVDGARVAAERIRCAIEAAPLDAPPVRLTVSIGLATGSDVDVLVRADAALYRAKRAGRNRVTLDRASGEHAATRPAQS